MKKLSPEEKAIADSNLLTFEVLEPQKLDGVFYEKGDTFQAYANLREHFESSGIAKLASKPEPKPKKDAK